MARQQNPNLEKLILAITALGPLADDMVFLGGSATGLLLTDPAAPPVRASIDVDVIVEVSTRKDYYELSEQLRIRGLSEDQSPGAPLCRWKKENLILDVMPTSSDILGFSNKWYQAAIAAADLTELKTSQGDLLKIRLVSAPYFLATKLEAFDGRGKGDYYGSHDMEDIIALIDGRPEIVDDVRNTTTDLRIYLSGRFEKLVTMSEFTSAVAGHLPPDTASQERVPIVMERIKIIAEMKK